MIATILRPWYNLGLGQWYPLTLPPTSCLLERLPATRDAATRLGLVTIQEMPAAMVWSIEHLPEPTRVIEVPEIRRLGWGNR